jgi:hypothetical protein
MPEYKVEINLVFYVDAKTKEEAVSKVKKMDYNDPFDYEITNVEFENWLDGEIGFDDVVDDYEEQELRKRGLIK